MAIAGHLPPIIVDAAGKPVSADWPPDLPLGAHLGAARRYTTVDLPPESTLLLYTDGLIERRDRPLSEGIRILLDSTAAGNPEELCSRLIASLLHDQALGDDVAILAVQRADNAAS